jgi:serine/threonine protein kinase
LLTTGTILSGYRIDGNVGKGGMGVVYEATQLSLSRKVALKLLTPELSEDADFRERFRREGHIQACMDHPHVIPVYEAGDTGQGLFLAMLLVRGPNLKRIILSQERDPERVLQLLTPIAGALDAAHEEGLIHRDIKPQNILVGREDHAYLADFGLTKSAGDRTLTKSGHFVGTLHYVSPEQIQGGEIGRSSDLYALAGVLYECLTGIVPYPKDSEVALIHAHLSEAPPQVTAACPDLPRAIDEVIAKGMAKDPSLRHGTATELMHEAAEALDEHSTISPAPSSSRPAARSVAGAPVEPIDTGTGAPARRDRRRLTRKSPASVAAILALAAVAGLLLGRSASNDEGQAGTDLASSKSIELSFPRSWRRAEQAPQLRGVRFKDAIALAPARAAPGDGLIAGQVASTGPRLLPKGFERHLRKPPGLGDPVELSKLDAYRYGNLHLRSGRRATLFVTPNTGGVATVACVDSSKTAGALLAGCERIANSLTLVEEESYPLGPDPDYAETLGTVIADLNDARLERRAKLGAAVSPAAQATLATSLGNAYEGAYRSLSRASVSPADQPINVALAIAARRTASGYADMSAAASANEKRRFEKAADRVRHGEAALSRGLRRLKRRGYELD